MQAPCCWHAGWLLEHHCPGLEHILELGQPQLSSILRLRQVQSGRQGLSLLRPPLVISCSRCNICVSISVLQLKPPWTACITMLQSSTSSSSCNFCWPFSLVNFCYFSSCRHSAVMAAAIGQCTAKTVLRCPHASLAPCSSRLCALRSLERSSSRAQGPAARPVRSTVHVRAASSNGTSPASSGLAINLTGTCCMIRPHACSKRFDSSLLFVAAGKKAFIAGVADDQVRIWAHDGISYNCNVC